MASGTLPAAPALPSAATSLPPESAPGAASGDQAPRAQRAYRRRKPFQMTQARREAAKANLARGREVLRQRGWPHSEKQRAAARENIQRAQAAIRERGLPATEKRQAAAKINLAKANARLRDLKYPRNEKQKAASRVNLAQARARLRDLNYPHSEKQRSAARANVSKAHAASREPKNYRRYHRHKLKHGLQVRSLEQTLRLLGEDPREFEAHCGRFARVFAPSSLAEEKLVRRIAAATWRHLRLFKAQARWQSDALQHFYERAPFLQPLDTEETRLRAAFLITLLLDRDRFYLHDQRLTAGVERGLRTLLGLRADGETEFQLYSRQTEKEWQEYERMQKEIQEERHIIEEQESTLRLRERLAAGGPEVERAIGRVRRELGRKK